MFSTQKICSQIWNSHLNIDAFPFMDKIIMFSALVFAAILSITTIDFAVVQLSNTMSDDLKHKEKEGKSCGF